MDTARKTKIAMLAATSLMTAAAGLTPASAHDYDPAAFPATIEASVVAHAGDQIARADHGSKPAHRAALIAVALGALGWLVKLLGPKKVLRAVEQTAQATVKASAAVAKSAARVVRSPLRYLAWVAGLIVFAMTGVSLFDIEWIGGLIAGAGLAGLAAIGTAKLRSTFSLQPLRIKTQNHGEQN